MFHILFLTNEAMTIKHCMLITLIFLHRTIFIGLHNTCIHIQNLKVIKSYSHKHIYNFINSSKQWPTECHKTAKLEDHSLFALSTNICTTFFVFKIRHWHTKCYHKEIMVSWNPSSMPLWLFTSSRCKWNSSQFWNFGNLINQSIQTFYLPKPLH